jgi:hypothetical protein
MDEDAGEARRISLVIRRFRTLGPADPPVGQVSEGAIQTSGSRLRNDTASCETLGRTNLRI